MKKYLSLFLIMFMCSVGLTGVVFADNSDDGIGMPKQEDSEMARPYLKDEIQGSKEGFRDQAEQMRMETKQKIDALREDIAKIKDKKKMAVAKMRLDGREEALGRFNDAVNRISAMKDKVNNQVAKLDLKSVDTGTAKTLIATAGTKLDAAKAKIAEAGTLLASSTNALSKENKDKLRTLAQDTQALIKDAHASLLEAVRSLKESLAKQRGMLGEPNEGQNNEQH